jgi:hypothetical protein
VHVIVLVAVIVRFRTLFLHSALEAPHWACLMLIPDHVLFLPALCGWCQITRFTWLTNQSHVRTKRGSLPAYAPGSRVWVQPCRCHVFHCWLGIVVARASQVSCKDRV